MNKKMLEFPGGGKMTEKIMSGKYSEFMRGFVWGLTVGVVIALVAVAMYVV